MILMVVFAIGDSVFALAFFAILLSCIFGKSDGVLERGGYISDFAAHAYEKGWDGTFSTRHAGHV
jgi:hypothetical protein